MTFGRPSVVEEEFNGLRGAERVLIFGSWAARYHGAAGAPPVDIDVLVIGSARRADVYEAADCAAQRLGIQINPVLRTAAQWEAASDSLVQQVQASPVVSLRSGEDAA